MKTKEEIEQLALQRFPIEMVVIFSKRGKVDKNKERRKIFIETYTQCQEDMADKKYTEEDIRKAILMARVRIENVSPKYSIDEIFLSLQPKTE